MFTLLHYRPLRSLAYAPVLSLLALFTSASGYAQSLSVTLTAADHHGFNISCFGLKDGSIHATVTGGTAPYTYTWSNGGTTADVTNLAAGYYGVVVRDANGTNARAEMTLSEPAVLRYEATLQEYPNGFNVSCYQCFNGNIQFTPIGGVAPFTYAWSDGPTTQNRSGLGEDALSVTITDLNGCQLQSETFQIRSPERTDWTMNGNANTNPSTQFIGTTDNKDVVFKSNGQERLRLLANGSIKLSGFNSPGVLKILTGGLLSNASLSGEPDEYWRTSGNWLGTQDQFLGTIDFKPLVVKTNNVERLSISPTGTVDIISPLSVSVPNNAHPVTVAHTASTGGGIDLVNTASSSSSRSELRFRKGADLKWTFGSDENMDGVQDFFIKDEAANTIPLRISNGGQLGLGLDATGRYTKLALKQDYGDWIQFHRTADEGFWSIRNDPDATQDRLAFYFNPPGSGLAPSLTLWNNGKVSIGTLSTASDDYSLFVAKGILTEHVKVSLVQNWPDYVFDKSYHLRPINDIEHFIQACGHLPGVPTAQDVQCNGLDLVEVNEILLEKVEELTLYLIQMNEKVSIIEEKLSSLKLVSNFDK